MNKNWIIDFKNHNIGRKYFFLLLHFRINQQENLLYSIVTMTN